MKPHIGAISRELDCIDLGASDMDTQTQRVTTSTTAETTASAIGTNGVMVEIGGCGNFHVIAVVQKIRDNIRYHLGSQ